MKKWLAIALLTMLVLTLCLPVFARYEVCSSCGNGRLVTDYVDTWDEWCEDCGEYVTNTVVYEACSNPNCDAGDKDADYGCRHMAAKYR